MITINCAAYFFGWELFALGFARVMAAVIPCDKLLESTYCYLLHCAHHARHWSYVVVHASPCFVQYLHSILMTEWQLLMVVWTVCAIISTI